MLTTRVYGNAVHDYYLSRVRRLSRAYDEKIDALKTKADAEKLVADSRRKIRRCFGPRPKKTPLELVCTGTTRRRGYRVDNLIYQSRPGLYVTANLYVPDKDGPLPGVVMACGHSGNGKAWHMYQSLCHSLAIQGYIVLIYDPVAQGERSIQYRDARGKPLAEGCCHEHNLMGNQMSLVGDFFGMWRAWDGIRSLDVLLSQPNIDKAHVGVTGCSGGGTLTTYLTALDERFTMAAPDCFVTTYLHNMENEEPADAEQIPPGILGAGMEMADFFIARAPRPTILLEEEQDFFDIRGVKVTYERLKKVYRLLGKPNDIQLYIGPKQHGYWQGGREACAAFFNRYTGIESRKREPKHDLIDDADLFATPKGDVLKLPGTRRVDEFTADAARELSRSRKKLTGKALVKAVTKTLNLPRRRGVVHYRTLRGMPLLDGENAPYQYTFAFGLETEADHDGLLAVLHDWQMPVSDAAKMPYQAHPTPTKDITLYLPHLDATQEVVEGLTPKPQSGHLWSLDARGFGMMRATTCRNQPFFTPYDGDYFYHCHGQMLGESYVGRRVHDVLCALDLLEARGAQRVHLFGRGLGSILATFAGVLHPVVKQVTLHGAPKSFQQIAESKMYAWPASMMPAGVLKSFDLPDCYAALKRKKLKNQQRADEMMQ